MVVTRDESMINHIDNTIISLNDTQAQQQDILDFLKKPIILNSGTFSIADTFSFLQSYSMPAAALNSSTAIVWRQKLAGFFGIRMDMRFKIVVNANIMQQGRYIIGWVPLASPAPTTSNLKNVLVSNMHMGTLVQRTTIPHVELDLATDTSAELLVPFVSVHNFYPLNTTIASTDLACLGYMNIYPYSPLVSPTGPSVCGYTLYVSFENVTLYGAASAQSGLSDREVAHKNNGPISGVARSLAKGFNEFSNIPLLSTYATPISWVADRIAKTASMFGFSKPTQGDNNAKVQILNCPSHTTVDGDCDARPLSFLTKSGTVTLDGLSGTHYDEMDFSYIIRKPAWFQSTLWAQTTVVGNLATFEVNPTAGIRTIGGATHMQPVAFVNQFFGLWRGSLKYKFKIVKTQFHSGRLQFCFYPTDESVLTGASEYVNRMIIDIRETTELELIIPYISRFPWTQTNTSIGVLTIDVVDILTAPSNVSNTVTILCEIAGGDDMEFAIPGKNDWAPTYFAPQSGLSDDPNKILTATIGCSSISSNPNIFSSTTVGDKVSNFRAYLKRFHPLLPNTKVTASTINPNGPEFYIWPDVLLARGVTPGTYFWNSDMMSTIGSCYAIFRGGVRLRNVVGIGNLASQAAVMSPAQIYFDNRMADSQTGLIIANGAPAVIPGAQAHNVIQTLSQNNVMTVEIPQYTQTLARSKADVINFIGSTNTYSYNPTQGSSNTKGTVTFSLPAGALVGYTAKAGYSVHNVYRALADDASFSAFISVPPMVSNSTSAIPRGFY